MLRNIPKHAWSKKGWTCPDWVMLRYNVLNRILYRAYKDNPKWFPICNTKTSAVRNSGKLLRFSTWFLKISEDVGSKAHASKPKAGGHSHINLSVHIPDDQVCITVSFPHDMQNLGQKNAKTSLTFTQRSIWLVVEPYPSGKMMEFVSWNYYSQLYGKHIKLGIWKTHILYYFSQLLFPIYGKQIKYIKFHGSKPPSSPSFCNWTFLSARTSGHRHIAASPCTEVTHSPGLLAFTSSPRPLPWGIFRWISSLEHDQTNEEKVKWLRPWGKNKKTEHIITKLRPKWSKMLCSFMLAENKLKIHLISFNCI